MPYSVFYYDKDQVYNDVLRLKLSQNKVKRVELNLAWKQAFDYVAGMGIHKVPKNPNLVVIGIRKPNGPFKVDKTLNIYSVVIKAFGQFVLFRYNKSLSRVSFRYQN